MLMGYTIKDMPYNKKVCHIWDCISYMLTTCIFILSGFYINVCLKHKTNKSVLSSRKES